jgi:hypothetical protein
METANQQDIPKAFTSKQLTAINAKPKAIAGQPTDEQVKAIVRSVILPTAN